MTLRSCAKRPGGEALPRRAAGAAGEERPAGRGAAGAVGRGDAAGEPQARMRPGFPRSSMVDMKIQAFRKA